MGNLLRSHTATLRAVAESLQLAPVGAIALRPGVQVVYRVTVYYFDHRACHAVATLTKTPINGTTLEVGFSGALRGQILSSRLDVERATAFTTALQTARFDRLPDDPQVPAYPSADLWFFERAAGSFEHCVILTPLTAQGPYAGLVAATQTHLPEVLRQLRP